jgi:hypothetical protein
MLGRLREWMDGRKPGPKTCILVVSLQKCGTHLIQKVLSEAGLTGRGVGKDCHLRDFRGLTPHEYLWSHFPPSDEILAAFEEQRLPLRIVFNYRDPRDALVSWFYWVHPENTKVTHSVREYMKKAYQGFSNDELLRFFLRGDKFRECEYNLLEYFRWSRVLLFHPRVFKVRFEDLIGPRGGGDGEVQRRTIAELLDHIGCSQADVKRIVRRAFDETSETFRKALVGEHRRVLTKDQLEMYNALHGDLLRQYGYE